MCLPGYDTSADIWSLACMIFELMTARSGARGLVLQHGDYLFDPKATSSCHDETSFPWHNDRQITNALSRVKVRFMCACCVRVVKASEEYLRDEAPNVLVRRMRLLQLTRDFLFPGVLSNF
eukprot:6462136-Amphidinium_carterae.1